MLNLARSREDVALSQPRPTSVDLPKRTPLRWRSASCLRARPGYFPCPFPQLALGRPPRLRLLPRRVLLPRLRPSSCLGIRGSASSGCPPGTRRRGAFRHLTHRHPHLQLPCRRRHRSPHRHLAWQLRGRRSAQLLAMTVVLAAPVFLGTANFMSMNPSSPHSGWAPCWL